MSAQTEQGTGRAYIKVIKEYDNINEVKYGNLKLTVGSPLYNL